MPHRRSPRYGWKFNHGPGPPLVENRAEQGAIRFILDLRSKGLGFREIARILNESGVSPRQGRGHTWDHTVVRREESLGDASLSVAAALAGTF